MQLQERELQDIHSYMTEIHQAVEARHQRLKQRHTDAGIALDGRLHEAAQAWADHLAKQDQFYHSTNAARTTDDGGYVGENLASRGDVAANALSKEKIIALVVQSVQDWYDEIALYDFDNPGYQYDAGHFTQMVWKDSTQLGVGVAVAKTDEYDASRYWYKVYLVGRYAPGGNINTAAAFRENVLPLGAPTEAQPVDQVPETQVNTSLTGTLASGGGTETDTWGQDHVTETYRFYPPRTGQYTVKISGYGEDSHGPYRLTVREVSPTPVLVNTATTSTLPNGGLEEFYFTPQPNTRYTISVDPEDWDVVLTVNGVQTDTWGEDTITEKYTLSTGCSPQTCWIGVSAYATGQGGNFTLRIEDSAN